MYAYVAALGCVYIYATHPTGLDHCNAFAVKL